jgi:ferritin-like metal-binding protein YciE
MSTKEMTRRDAVVVQYLNDAYATERRLEIALQAHIAMTSRADYKKRLNDHLKETKAHARSVERRINALGGDAETASVAVPAPDALIKGAKSAKAAVQKAAAAAQGPLHAMRGTGEQERMLKNARTEYQDEAEEIATYRAIEAVAEAVGDKETAKLARDIAREEKRMADYLVEVIDELALDVVHDEVPVAEIGGRPAARRTASESGATTRAKATSSQSKASTSGSKATTSRARSKPASRASGKPASRASGKPASRASSKPASRASSKPASRASSKPASRASGKPASRANSKPASRTSGKPASRANSKPASRTSSKPASRASSKPASRASSKPASRASGKPASRANSKPASRTSSKPASRARPPPGPRPRRARGRPSSRSSSGGSSSGRSSSGRSTAKRS